MIDFHLHMFPDHLAQRALHTLSRTGGGLEPCFDGTAAGLQALMAQNGIDVGVALMIATKPEQEMSVNRFAIEHNHDNLVVFGSINPHSKLIRKHLLMLKEAGIKGIKLHPEYQQFAVDAPEILPIYQMIAEMGFITVFHAGADIGFDLPYNCRPRALAKALPYFQGASVVAAHFGGYIFWEEVARELVGKPVYFDTSYCYGTLPIPMMTRMIRDHGVDHILYGSDAPWSDPRQEIGLIHHLALTDAEKSAILDHNARRLLGLPKKGQGGRPHDAASHPGHS
jgi:predicted TIM-barrel fold metal-dependent hydrolase